MSSTYSFHAKRYHPRRFRGVALVVILILLMAITAVVAFSARQAVVGESSARNQMDYEIARQAAEAALRDGERDVLGQSAPTNRTCPPRITTNRFSPRYFTSECQLGQCSESVGVQRNEWKLGSSTAQRWWPDEYGGKWVNSNGKKNRNNCDFRGGVPIGSFTDAKEIEGVEYQPEYLLEYLHRDMPVVRVTARGFGVVGIETQVVLQSYVRLPIMAP